MSDKVSSFLKENWMQFGAVIVAAIMGYAQLQEVNRRVETLEKQGSPFIRERLLNVEQSQRFVEQRVVSIESDAKQTAAVISEFRSDLRLVVEWVKDQKRKDKL